jgi:hypothetical protein
VIPKYLQLGASILVRMGQDWQLGTVAERNGRDIVAEVRGRRIAIHASVIRRDVKAAK